MEVRTPRGGRTGSLELIRRRLSVFGTGEGTEVTREDTVDMTALPDHAIAGTATLAEHLLIRSLERDFVKLSVRCRSSCGGTLETQAKGRK